MRRYKKTSWKCTAYKTRIQQLNFSQQNRSDQYPILRKNDLEVKTKIT